MALRWQWCAFVLLKVAVGEGDPDRHMQWPHDLRTSSPVWVVPNPGSSLCVRAGLWSNVFMLAAAAVGAACLIRMFGETVGRFLDGGRLAATLLPEGVPRLSDACPPPLRRIPGLLGGGGFWCMVIILGYQEWSGPCSIPCHSPVLDSQGNAYLGFDSGLLLSVDARGVERWKLKLGEPVRSMLGRAGQLPTPAIAGGILYTTDGNGTAYALRVEDGSRKWRSRYAYGGSFGMDSWDVLVHDGAVAVLGPGDHKKSVRLFVLDVADGSVLWSRDVAEGSVQAHFRVQSSRSTAEAPGLVFRSSKSLDDQDSARGLAEWGSIVHGVIKDDWLQVAPGLYLPVFVNDERVLAQIGEARPRHLKTYHFKLVASSGLLIYADVHGSLHALDIKSGMPSWYTPTEDDSNAARGGVVAALDGNIVFTASETQRPLPTGRMQKGSLLSAYDSQSGTRLWQRELDLEAHVAPTTYRLSGMGGTAVALGLGPSTGFPWPVRSSRPAQAGRLVAFEAQSGDPLWSLDAPPWRRSACAGSSWLRICKPNTWSGIAADSSGALFAGYHDGSLLAVNGTTGDQISHRPGGSAFLGMPVLGHGLLLTASCSDVSAFGTATREVDGRRRAEL